jgi:GT2 family glycosyltransferase
MKNNASAQDKAADEVNGRNWPTVSLLILNWNGKALLQQHLPSFLNLDYPSYQVVIADNGSTDGSVAFVQEQFPQFTLIPHGQNLGFSPGNNAAMRQLDSDVIVLLNNDVSVTLNWLRALVRPMLDDPTIGITGGKLLYPDGKTLQHAGAYLSYPLAFSRHDYHRELDEGQADEQRDVPYVTGAAMAVHRKVVEAIGLLDEVFAPIYYEEVDYCYRARTAGFRVVYVPEAVGLHHESFTMRQMSSWHTFALHKNRLHFVLRHYSADQFFDEYVPAEIARIQTPKSAVELYQLRRALLAIQLMLPEILQERGKEDVSAQYNAALNKLRQAALAQRPRFIKATQGAVEMQLAAKQKLKEPVFKSDTPLIGSMVAAFRQLWNNVATKWYVRGLIRQQMAFNQLVTRLLGEQDRQDEALAQEVNLLAGELQTMQQRLKQIEALLAAQKPGSKLD